MFSFKKIKKIITIACITLATSTTFGKNIVEFTTSLPVFVGQTNKGSLHKLVKINNFTEFKQHFGTTLSQRHLDKQIELYFLNGGHSVYIYRTQNFISPDRSLNLAYTNTVLTDLTSPLSATKFDIITFTDLYDFSLNNYTLFLNQYLNKLDEAHLITLIDSNKNIDQPEMLKDLITNNHFIFNNLTVLYSQNQKYGAVGATIGAIIKNDFNYNIKKPLPRQKLSLGNIQPKKTFSQNEILKLTEIKISAVVHNGQDFTLNHLWTTNDAPEFLHLSVSRVFYMIYKNIKFHLNYYKSMNNNITTWNQVKNDIDSYFQNLYQNNILDGQTSKEAYFTRVDETTITPDDILNKRMNVMYGINLLNRDYLIFKHTQYMD